MTFVLFSHTGESPPPPTQLQEMKEHTEELMSKGTIVPSKSNNASAIVLVRKKNGDLRMCTDYVQNT